MKFEFKKVNWLAGWLTPLAVALMEATCIYPWLVYAGRWHGFRSQGDVLAFPTVLLLIAGGYLVTRFFLRRPWRLPLTRLAIVLAGLAAIFLIIRLEYGLGYAFTDNGWFPAVGNTLLDIFSHPHPLALAIPLAFFLYWRGIRRATAPLYFQTIYPTFLLGLASLVILIIIWSLTTGADELWDLTAHIGIYVAAFFFSGLATLALTNLENIQTRLQKKEGAPASFGRRWLGIITGIIAVVVGTGVLIASAFSTQFIDFWSRIFGFIWNIVEKAAYYIFLPFGYLVGWLLDFFRWLIALIRRKPPAEETETAGQGLLPEYPEVVTRSLSPEVILILKWTFFALVLGLLIFWLVRTILKARAEKQDDDILEENESLWSWHGFRDDLKQWLKSLRPRVPALKPHAAGDDNDGKYPARLDIREIYTRLLRLLACLNLPRKPFETPYEYQTRVEKEHRDQQPALETITNHYVKQRYGEIAPDENTLTELNAAWQNLRGALPQDREQTPH